MKLKLNTESWETVVIPKKSIVRHFVHEKTGNELAEIVLPDGEELHVIYPVGAVEDITVTVHGDQKTYPDYTVFRAFEMADNDAVVLHLPNGQADKISITYLSDNQKQELPLTQ